MGYDVRPLDMRSAVDLLGIPCDTRKNSARVRCPVCGHKSLGIDFRLDRFNCPACEGIKGGYLELWAFYRNIDARDAEERRRLSARDYYMFMKGSSSRGKTYKPPQDVLPEYAEMPMADIEERSRTYNALLTNLPLKNNHRQNLIKRGLDDAEISRLAIKSAPTSQLRMVLKKMEEHLALEGIPGLFRDNEGTKAVRAQGYLIPQRDIFGRIQGCQVRLDEAKEGKYRAYSSSGMENGTSSSNFVHVAAKDYKNLNTQNVIITEGPLKADIISFMTGYTTLAVPGVNSLSKLPEVLEELKQRETKLIHVAFDMDYLENKHVARGLDKIFKMLSDYGFKYKQIVWDPKYKGFDDYLLSIEKKLTP